MEKDIITSLFNLYRENKMAHAYLIETDNIEKCYLNILKLVKMINCKNKYSDRCNDCNLCNLADNLLLPSLYVISSDGKSINKDAIEQIKNAFIMAPVYTENNIYIIKEAENMNSTAYNKMLKFLEEPNDNIIGFFITKNSSNIPDTIFSRLELIKMMFNEVIYYDENIIKYANEYLEIITEDLEKGIWYNSSVLEKSIKDRSEYVNLFNIMLNKCLEKGQFKIAILISKYLNEFQYNVNLSLLLDSFIIEVGEINGK